MQAMTVLLYYVPGILLRIIVLVVVWKLIRQTSSRGMKWLLLAIGVWPFIQTILSTGLNYLMISARMTSGLSVPAWYTLSSSVLSLAFPVIHGVLCIVATMLLVKDLVRLPGPEPLCPNCQYNLRGLDTNRCPECGIKFTCETRYFVQPRQEHP